MSAALVQVCVDPRLNHELIRLQVQNRLQGLGLAANRIFIVGDIGGNVGDSTANTLDLLVKHREPVVFTAVLHHDDCAAGAEGLRQPLATSASSLSSLLVARRITCPVLTGSILTASNQVSWTDAPARSYEVLPFRMPKGFP